MKYSGVEPSRIAKLDRDILDMGPLYLGDYLALFSRIISSAAAKTPPKAKKDATGAVRLEPTCST